MSLGQVTDSNAVAGRGALWLAFAWGLAEATFFFLVPDVLTSRLALTRTRTAFVACFWSLAGALIGGVLLYFVGSDSVSATQLLAFFTHLPGIDAHLAGTARAGLEQNGLLALFSGVLAGIPYKLYATQAVAAGVSFTPFVAASFVARLTRFLAVTALAWVIGAKLLKSLSPRVKLQIHAVCWIVFYAVYFWRMRN